MAARKRAKSKVKKRAPRPPRLRPDRRRTDPRAFEGISPSAVPYERGAEPPERAAWNAAWESETFTKVEHDDQGKPKPGRPRVPINLDDVRKVGLLGCTDSELASFFAVSVRTVERRKLLDPEFCRALDEGRNEAKLSVRRMQLVMAVETKDWRALEWLGRNWLGQRKEPFVDAPPPNQGKSPLLETLERMERALANDSAQSVDMPVAPSSDEPEVDTHAAEPDDPEAPAWRRE